MKKIFLASLIFASSIAIAAEPQRYLKGVDAVAPQAAPTIESKGNGVIVATFQNVDGTWSKYTLTPTTDKFYGAFGEPIVTLDQVIPNP